MILKHFNKYNLILLTALSSSVFAETCEQEFVGADDENLVIFCEAALRGNKVALNYIAKMYEDGIGIKQNDSKAVEWYQKRPSKAV